MVDVNRQGEEIVRELSAEYRNAGGKLTFQNADISDWDELATVFEQVFKRHGRIDIVLANAGISKEDSLIVDEEKPSKPRLTTLDVNLTGTIYSKILL